MSEIRIDGADSIPTHPMLVMPNRVDLPTMLELEKALGGRARVAWMVENSVMPGEAIMHHIQQTQPAGFVCSINKQGRETIISKVRHYLETGRYVVLLPGRPLQAPGSLTDIPGQLLTLFDGTNLNAMPVYIGMYNEYFDAAITTREPYDRLHISFTPPAQAGNQLGARVQAAWMSAQTEQLEQHPLLEKTTLSRLLVDSLLRNPEGQLRDGVDDSTLPYRNLLAAVVITTGLLEEYTSTARIGIILPPGKLNTIANLACLLTGITAVNINYSATPRQVDHIIKQAGLTRFITDSRFTNMPQDFAWPPERDLIFLNQELAEKGPWKLKAWSTLSKLRSPQQFLQHAKMIMPAGDAEAAVLFTGGTEDKPMGVPFTHRMLLAAAICLRSRLQLNPGHDILLSIMPSYTPAGLIAGLLLPLLGGFDMVTYTLPLAGKRICTLVQMHAASLVINTPAGTRAMLKAAKDASVFSSLQYCLCSGAKMPSRLADEAMQHFRLKVLECYGAAEVLPFAAASMPAPDSPPELSQPSLPTARTGCVGAPIPGVAVRITGLYSPEASPTPSNPGLVWLKGPAVTRRYLGVSNEQSKRMHGNWFCTGDVGFMSADGMLTILGRKVRFTQMGNEMIPHVLLEEYLYKILNVPQDDNVRKLAIVGVPNLTGGEELVLLSTLHKEVTAADYSVLRNGVSNMNLPRNWVPRHIIPVKFIPTLANGKLNYQACFEGTCQMLNIKID